MMAIACGVVLLGIFWIVPTLALIPLGGLPLGMQSGYALGTVPGETWIRHLLERLLDTVCRHRVAVIATAFVLLLVGLTGSFRLKVETDFLKNFQANSPIAQAYRAVETELGGAGIWDVMVPAPKPITEDYFDRIVEMEKELLAIQVPAKDKGGESLGLTSALSLADTDQVARSATVLRMVPIEARLLGMKQTMGKFFETLLSEPDSTDPTQSIGQVRQVVNRYSAEFGSSSINDTAVTGYYVLLTKLVEHVVADQWKSFAVAALGIGLAMTIALRSFKFALVAMVPAILPSLVVLGVLGWLGVRMNLGAAMIAAVSMGLGVDSSLHYLFRYRQERSGGNVMESLRCSQGETGMAVLMATLALVLGFGSMAASDFLPTVAFGTLAAWTMLGGLIGNLCLLPAMVTWLEGPPGEHATERGT